MPLPAPPGPDTSAPNDPNSVENIIPSVQHSKVESVLSAIGNRGLGVAAQISGTPQEDFSNTTIGKLLGEHYTQRLNDARRHASAARSYDEALMTGVSPTTGQALTDEERSQYEGMREGAYQDYLKSVGHSKDAKDAVQQRKDFSDTVLQHGIDKVHPVLSKLGVFGDPNAPPVTPPAPPLATQESIGAGRTTLPAPPATSGLSASAGLAAGTPATAMGATSAELAQRQLVARKIGITAENNPVEFQQLMSTGKIPFGAAMTLLADDQTGDQVSPDAIKADGTPLSADERTADKHYRTQRSPYTGQIIVTPHTPPTSTLPTLIRYKGLAGTPDEGKDVFGYFTKTGPATGHMTDQHGTPLPPGTEAFDASLAPTTSATTGPHYTVDKDGNTVVNMGTSVTTRTRGTAGAGAGAGAGGTSLPPLPETPAGAEGPAGATPAAPTPAQKPAAAAPLAPKPGVGPAVLMMGPDGEPLHKQLSEPARQGIGNVIIAEDLMDQITPDLTKIVADIKAQGGDPNSWFRSAQERSAWEQYVQGIDPSQISEGSILQALPNIDPRLAKLFPKLALLTITGSQPYLRNVRNYNYVRDIRQHLPNLATDTPRNMISKMDALMDNLPNLERAAYEQEGVQSKPFKYATPANVQGYAKGHNMPYDEAAHYFRRGGYKISHE